MRLLGPYLEGELIQRNYPSIQHLSGSKMIDVEDKLIGADAERMMTVDTGEYTLSATEKVDGCNVGVLKREGLLYPILRSGYDVRGHSQAFIRDFAYYVESKATRFASLLNEGERVCGEWCVKTHTLRYSNLGDPFIPFGLMLGKRRSSHMNMRHRVEEVGFTPVFLLHHGIPISVKLALEFLKDGHYGALDGPEGVVFCLEKNGVFVSQAKFVSNPLLGNAELFRANMDDDLLYNKYKY